VHRLVCARRQIEDRKAAVSETDWPVHPNRVVVWASVAEHRGHRVYTTRIRGLIVVNDSSDAADGLLLGSP